MPDYIVRTEIDVTAEQLEEALKAMNIHCHTVQTSFQHLLAAASITDLEKALKQRHETIKRITARAEQRHLGKPHLHLAVDNSNERAP